MLFTLCRNTGTLMTPKCPFYSPSAEESHQFPPRTLRESQNQLLNNGQSDDRVKRGERAFSTHLIIFHTLFYIRAVVKTSLYSLNRYKQPSLDY